MCVFLRIYDHVTVKHMKALHQRVYKVFATTALLLALGWPAQAQDMAAVPTERINLMQYVMQERPVLADLITKAGLTPTLSEHTSYTIMAPPDAELEKLQDLPPVRLRAMLLGYMLKGLYHEKDFKDGAILETLAHTKMNVCRKKDHTLIDGVRLNSTDKQVENGILHNLSGKLNL